MPRIQAGAERLGREGAERSLLGDGSTPSGRDPVEVPFGVLRASG